MDIKRFHLYTVNLDPTIGAEMQKTRPCLVVSPDEMNLYLRTVTILPLTSISRELPTRVLIEASSQSGLNNDSYAAVDQIKTVDKTRLGTVIGEISEAEKQKIAKVILETFEY